jgi:TrmH family RNA methyltransferase
MRPSFPAFVKRYAGLKYEKGRLKFSQFLAEGPKIISEIISIAPNIIEKIFISQKFNNPALVSLIKKNRLRTSRVKEEELRFMADTQNNQGIVAVARFASLKPNWALCRYVTLLDEVQDPGNVGAILRTSIALGMDAVILGKGTCDIYNPKVVRSSAGTFLRLPFEVNVDLFGKVNFLRQKGFSILATSSHAHYTVSQIKLRRKVALIVSNEGSGIGEKLKASADEVIRVPLNRGVESLNVAVAHGIIAYEMIGGRK